MWERGPCRPEQTDRKHKPADGHQDESSLLISTFCVVRCKSGINRAGDHCTSAKNAGKDTEEGAAGHCRLETALLLECDRIGEEEEVGETVCTRTLRVSLSELWGLVLVVSLVGCHSQRKAI